MKPGIVARAAGVGAMKARADGLLPGLTMSWQA
jgi:hypothetical protein